MAAATRDSSGRMCTMDQGGWRFPLEEVSLSTKEPGRMESWRGRESSGERMVNYNSNNNNRFIDQEAVYGTII